MEWRFPHVTKTVDLDGQDELRAHLCSLRDDYEFIARVLGYEPEEVNVDVEVVASVDFGAEGVDSGRT